MPTQAGAQTPGHDPGAKIFHWVTVALIGAQFIIGLIMPSMHH
jgi:cytochrome b561